MCAECGQPYRRQIWKKYGVSKAVWRCDNRLKHGSKRCKHSTTLKEESLHEAIMASINSVVEDQGEFVQAFRENVIRIIGNYSTQTEPTEYDEPILRLQQNMMSLIEDSTKSENSVDIFDQQYQIIVNEIKEMKKKKARVIQERNLAERYEQRKQDIDSYMKKVNYLKREFDDDLVRRLLQSIRVINERKIENQFKSGILVQQKLLYDN